MKKRGFEKTTIREIASLSKVALGTVMAHFGSKEALLFEVFYEDIQRIADEAFAEIDASQPLNESLTSIGEAFLGRYAEEPEMYADFLEHSLFAVGEWGQRFTKQAEAAGMKIAPLFQLAIQRNEIQISDDEIRPAVMTFFANYYFVLINQIKSRFANIEVGLRQLRVLVDHHYRGLTQ